jgi:hypothetical protein
MVKAKPVRMAARLEWRRKRVNQKIPIKIGLARDHDFKGMVSV